MADSGVQFPNFFANECLSYIQFYLNNSSYNLKKFVENFFVGHEITAAKNLLWMNCNSLGDKPVKRDSSMRIQSSADVINIIEAFKKIEENNFKIPIYVTVKLDRIPRHVPKDINMQSLITPVMILLR